MNIKEEFDKPFLGSTESEFVAHLIFKAKAEKARLIAVKAQADADLFKLEKKIAEAIETNNVLAEFDCTGARFKFNIKKLKYYLIPIFIVILCLLGWKMFIWSIVIGSLLLWIKSGWDNSIEFHEYY